MGQYHTLVYAELWDVDLVGVVDIDFERARRVAAGRKKNGPQRRRSASPLRPSS